MGNSGLQWICCKIATVDIDRYWDTAGDEGYGEIQAAYK